MKISVRGTFIDIDLRAAPAGAAISPGEPDRWDLLVLEIPTIDRTLVLRRPAKVFGGIAAAAELVVKIATDGKMANAATAWTIAGTCYKTLRDLSRRSPELRTALEPVRQAMKLGKVGSKGRKGAAAARSTGELREGPAREALVLRTAPSNGATNGVASPATH